MDTTFTATTSGKPTIDSGKNTPFDQISQLEIKEEQRVQQELDAMAREKDNAQKVIEQKEEQSEQEFKDSAKKELKEYSESELGKILKAKEVDGERECNELDNAYQNQAPSVAANLVSMMTNTDSPLFNK